VAKLAGHEQPVFRGRARVFNREEDAFVAVKGGKIKPGDFIVIRYEGPKGGPGMREMLHVTGALQGAGLGGSVGLMTDGRFSGATHGSWWATWRRRPRRAARALPSGTGTRS
jgi:dihydroxy-acid dehydratase